MIPEMTVEQREKIREEFTESHVSGHGSAYRVWAIEHGADPEVLDMLYNQRTARGALPLALEAHSDDTIDFEGA